MSFLSYVTNTNPNRSIKCHVHSNQHHRWTFATHHNLIERGTGSTVIYNVQCAHTVRNAEMSNRISPVDHVRSSLDTNQNVQGTLRTLLELLNGCKHRQNEAGKHQQEPERKANGKSIICNIAEKNVILKNDCWQVLSKKSLNKRKKFPVILSLIPTHRRYLFTFICFGQVGQCIFMDIELIGIGLSGDFASA